MRSAIKRALQRPRAPLAVIALSVLLLSPSLTTGLTGDDHFHALVLEGSDIEAVPTDPFDLFVWADGDPATAQGMMDVGMIGWWSDPALVMAYFRPLSVLTHLLDFALWPDAPWLMHLQSIAWFALALVGLAAFYRRVLGERPAWVATFALALYALDDAHAMSVAWVANRNAVVALALSSLVLWLHDRGARDGHRPSTWAAPLVLAAALLAGEAALAVTAYLFAYALWIDRRGAKAGLVALWPHALLAVSWALFYRASGYGARGSGLVIDPGGEPLRFLGALAVRMPMLLSAQLGFPPSDAWVMYGALAPWLPAAMLAWAVVVVGVFGAVMWPLIRREPVARFFAVGGVVGLLPVCAQFPHDRLLLFVGVGGAGLMALWLEGLMEGRPEAKGRVALGVLWVAFALHVVIAPLWLPLRARGPADANRMIAATDRAIGDDPALSAATVVLINPPADGFAGYVPTQRAAMGRRRPAALRWLATGASDVTLERIDARSLRVRPAEGFLSLPSERMQRGPARPFRKGQQIALSGMQVRVTDVTGDGRPAEAVASFDAPLEDPRYRFYAWQGAAPVEFTPPPVGDRIILPRVTYGDLLPPLFPDD